MLLHGMKQEKHGEGPPPSTHHQPQSQHHSAPLYLEAQTRKRTREDDKPSFHDTHKDDGNKGGNWQLTALEHPVPPPQPRIAITHPWTQTRASLLPDPDVYIYNPTTTTTTTNKQEEGDTTRLPSIKHLRLDPTRPRHEWDPYGANPAHPTHAYSHYPTAPSYSPTQRSPLKVTQTITAPPPSPQPQVTELVQVKTNTYGFIETTFTNVPAKKAHRRRPANVDKTTLYCHTCGSKNTPEWRRGPQGPATLCNACGLAYAKRLRQEEESQATARLEQEQQQQQQQHQQQQYAQVLPPSPSSQFPPYPTLSDLYQHSALFQSLPGYQPPLSHITTEHGWVPHSPSSFAPASFSPSRPSPTFRSVHNRPNGHTFHQYTPPASHSHAPSRSPGTYLTSSPHVPVATTTTTTTTTALFPFNVAPSEIPIVTPPEPPNTNSGIPVTPTINTSSTLPLLTTLSTSTDDLSASSSLGRYPSLSYRTVPNTPTAHPLTASSSFSSLYTPATPTASAPYTPSTPSTLSASGSSHFTLSSSTSSSSASPASSPSHSPSSSMSSRSPSLTPITTIAALSTAPSS